MPNNEGLSDQQYDAIQWQESVGCAAFEAGKARAIQQGMNAEKMPRGNHRWELSWAVQDNLMRIRQPESGFEWFYVESVGHTEVLGVNDITHRINIYGQAKLQDGILYLFRPTGMRVPKVPSGHYLPNSQYRLCANIAGNNWRLRDEPTSRLIMVDGYKGSWHNNYLDRGSHLFHLGDGVICPDNVFHFIDPDLEWEWEAPGVEHHCKDV